MGKRVLLAEDEPNITISLRFLLERAGFEVTCRTDGREALETVIEMAPELVVLDVMLPGIDGFEVLRGIRATPGLSGVPVIVLTAKGQREDRERALSGGADLFITKPFSNAEVVEAAHRLTAGAAA